MWSVELVLNGVKSGFQRYFLILLSRKQEKVIQILVFFLAKVVFWNGENNAD